MNRTTEELINDLILHLNNKIQDEIIKENLNYILKNLDYYLLMYETRVFYCNEIATNQKEFDILFLNYEKAIKKILSFYKIEIEEAKAKAEEEEERKNKQNKKIKIFGISPLTLLLLTPVACLIDALKKAK